MHDHIKTRDDSEAIKVFIVIKWVNMDLKET